MSRGRLVTAATVLLGACYNPQWNAPSCGPNDECPPGLHCEGDVCVDESAAPDARREDAPGLDAIDVDAMPLACHQENNDAGNDLSSEATGRTGPSPIPIVCGSFADRVPAANGVIDADRYAFTSTAPLIAIRINAPGAADFTGGVQLSVTATHTWMAGDHGLINAGAGATVIVLTASAPAQLGHEVPYEISVEELDPATWCLPSAGTPFTETLDTVENMSTGNDVVAPVSPQIAATLTTIDTDVPETLPAAFDPGVHHGVNGVTEVVPGTGGPYKDRDSYRFTTGADVDAVDLRLEYSGVQPPPDLDLYLFRETDLGRQMIGYNVGTEASTVAVEPATTYLLVVGHFNVSTVPQPYQLGICASAWPK